MTTGEKIKQLRKQLGMTQEELGNLIGVQKAAINKYETGVVVNLKQATIAALAKALHVSPVELLSPEDPPNGNQPQMDPEIRIVSGMMENMSQEQKEQIVAIVRAVISTSPPDKKG